MFFPVKQSQAGTTILETLISSAIVAGSVMVLSSTLAQQSRAARDLDERFTAAELSKAIVDHIDCAETIHRVCDKGDARLFAPGGVIHLTIPYRVEQPDGLALEVTCDRATVNAVVSARGSFSEGKSKPLFADGVCRRRFSGPRKCPSGKVLTALDDESGKIKCAKGP